ncbi:TIR domain-containing protein [Levilactobacillus parabrevis]|uniref:TIR domain-containing protein n=1 Tax=Levilactobacillus parabrevis TaxID=357278 RepID=UPI0037584561
MCFSSADREPYVHALFYQLKTLGINVWYDYDNLRLGDNRCEKNLVLPFQNIQVAIIVISHNLFRSACAIEEFQKN